MSEKIRGAIFNMLGDISGLSVLDAFAGSGALAIEAISRGASTAVTLDNDSAAVATIRRNLRQLKLENKVSVTQAPVQSWIQLANQRFDLVFADPPYNDPQLTSVQALHKIVAADGLLIVSLPPTTAAPAVPGMDIVKSKAYGDATITIYQPAS